MHCINGLIRHSCARPILLHLKSVLLFLILGLASQTLLAKESAAPTALVSSGSELMTVKSGKWSDPNIWDAGRVPGEGDNVVVETGHTVVYNVASSENIRLVHVRGRLTFSREINTRLDVGMLIVSGAETVDVNGNCSNHAGGHQHGQTRPVLEVGTPLRPIPADVTAKINLIHFSDIDQNCSPGIISYGGRMDFHGAPMQHTWLKLENAANKGAKSLTVTDNVAWQPGDRIIVTGTVKNSSFKGDGDSYQNGDAETEENVVTSVSGKTIQLQNALKYDHMVDGEFRADVANLSRNVVIASKEPNGVRGHTMFHHGSIGGISYAEFAQLGKDGVLARYPIHYHLMGNSIRGSSIVGASIWDSHNRWITIHGTNYLVLRDNVGYQSLGHGYFMEDASEVFNLLEHNLAVKAFSHEKIPGQALEYDKNEGAGFWWANGRNAFINNTAAECDQYGYQFDVPEDIRASVMQPDGNFADMQVNKLPFIVFRDNEAHGMRMYGFWGNGDAEVNDPFVFENFRSWQLRYALAPNGRNTYIKNLDVLDVTYGFYGQDPHDVRVENITGRDIGNFIVDVYLKPQGLITVDNVIGDGLDKWPLRITGKKVREKSCDVHLRNVKLTNVEDGYHGVGSEGGNAKSSPDLTMYLHDYFGPDRDAKVIPSNQSRNDGLTYKDMSPVFEDNVKVAEVNVPFPESPIKPIDTLGPATVITYPPPEIIAPLQSDGSLLVRGTCIDASDIASLTVNGVQVTPTSENYRQWEVRLKGLGAGEVMLTTAATDVFGNKELNPHTLNVLVDASTAVSENGDAPVAESFALLANYPNPFNPETTIAFRVPSGASNSQVKIRIYDVLSRQVRMLVDGAFSGGEYKIQWDARDDYGLSVSSGVYFYELEVRSQTNAPLFRQTRKMVLSR